MAGPVTGKERIEAADILRGFALFGILLINITTFKAPGALPGFNPDAGPIDRVVTLLILLLVESKFFTLFSLLFGLGFAIQLVRAQERGERFVPRFSRRLLVLLLFGIAHVVFLWEGDILILYALVGFLLLLFRNAAPRTLLRWAAGLLAVPIVLVATGLVTLELLRASSEFGAQIRAADAGLISTFAELRVEAERTYGSGSYGEIMARRVTDYVTVIPLLLSRVPSVLAMFLLGLYVGKRGILRRVEDHLTLLRRVRFWGLLAGLTISVLVVTGQTLLPPLSALVALLFNQALAGPVLSMGYAATLVLLVRRPAWQRRFAPLAASGRMALTNYLTQSLVCTLLFYSYGLGLAGQVGGLGGAAIATAIYAVQIGFSMWWLRRFQFGPLEWLWRSLTYMRRQPWRKARAAAA